MAPNTRLTQRDPVKHLSDCDMDEGNHQLALPAPTAQESGSRELSQAIQPASHPELTNLQAEVHHPDLNALLAGIPSTVHVENLAFSVSQNTIVNQGVDMKAVQAYVQQADAMIAELQSLVHAQFAAGTTEMGKLEARVAYGCQQLCVHVHTLAS